MSSKFCALQNLIAAGILDFLYSRKVNNRLTEIGCCAVGRAIPTLLDVILTSNHRVIARWSHCIPLSTTLSASTSLPDVGNALRAAALVSHNQSYQLWLGVNASCVDMNSGQLILSWRDLTVKTCAGLNNFDGWAMLHLQNRRVKEEGIGGLKRKMGGIV